ncbi:hypothetical protein MSAN_00636000 [Mycena sanguinolenta]|uniref:Uncharacterized protein n=1 Tax=Mycena sanguinolenta TaxID=230812 RepID=A0A8H7DD61_9AGAR|nr:hypothetical protein MSAN_00636000 [Mycena sanguinolenta]
MLVSYPSNAPVFEPVAMSKPFKRQKMGPDALRVTESTRSPSPAASLYGDGLRPHDLPPRAASPASSFYSQYSSSSPSIDSVSSSGSRRPLPTPPTPQSPAGWLGRSPRIPPSLTIVAPPASEFASPPDTPVEVSEAELRRRQLEKAARILGESVPLELVFQSRHPLIKAFPSPPPRRSTDGPQPDRKPKETKTEQRPKKLVRRASLSLSTLTSKFRTAPPTRNHSRDSSQDSQSSPSSDSQQSYHSPVASTFTRTLPRRSSVLGSPILFAFPRRSPTTTHIPPPLRPSPDHDLVIDIRSPDPSIYGRDDDEEATPIRESPSELTRSHVHSPSEALPRIVPMPTHAHTDSEPIFPRPDTPFADYVRSATPYVDRTRPTTPFERARPTTPFSEHLDPEDEPTVTSTVYLAPGVSRKERGQGWSGEWNQRDMQHVIHKLRSLK